MLAFFRGTPDPQGETGEKVARSLGLFAGASAPRWADQQRQAWRLPRVYEMGPRPRRASKFASIRLQPHVLPDGRLTLFHGWFDNIADVARQLGCPHGNPDEVYGLAVARWGDLADRHITGFYCAIHDDPDRGLTRLSRSPFGGPPLHYVCGPDRVGAASVPRALEAMGHPRELNRRRLADSLFFNLHDDEGYLRDSYRVGFGEIVHAGLGSRRTVRYHDPLAVPDQPRMSAQDCVAEADRLLEEAVSHAYRSGPRPGIQLSAGLDSSNVAARILRQMPPGETLKSFTYFPLAGHGQAEIADCLIDEKPGVEAFAAQYPNLEPHFIDNAETGYDTRLRELFLAMGTGSVNVAGLFRYQGLFQAASEQNCGILLSSDFGNCSFSSDGEWAFSEYLVTGRWWQLYRALTPRRKQAHSLLRRFFSHSVMPLLPDFAWQAIKSRGGSAVHAANEAICALRQDVIDEFDVRGRARKAGVYYLRDRYASRRQMIQDNLGRGDIEGWDIIQAFEQVYEVACRDATLYRPLIEFCLGLPTGMFMRDGTSRWLARELGKGLMPEPQRLMPGHNKHDTDWHVRYTPRLPELREAVARMRTDPDVASLIDIDVLEETLDNWPDRQTLADDAVFACSVRLPRAIAMAEYIAFMSGRN